MTESRSVVAWGWEKWGEISKRHEETLGEMDIFTILNVEMVSQVYIFVKFIKL